MICSFLYCCIYSGVDVLFNNLFNGISVGYLLFDSYRAVKYKNLNI